MISEKMKTFVSTSSVIRAMFEEGKKMAAKYGAENVYDYSLGNPSVYPPSAVKDSIIHILNTEDPNLIHGYTNNSGYEDVRQFVAESTNQEFGTSFSMENVVMTTGAAAALNIIFKTILNPGDEVVVFAPFFGEYRNYISNYDGKTVVIPPDTATFQINFQAFEQALNKNTKAVIVNTPNNPTGIVYTEATIQRLGEILSQKEKEVGHSIFLISDEPYRRLVYDDTPVPFVSKYYKNTFVAYSFSKALSLPGERIGYVLVNSEIDDFEDTMFSLNVANRICGFVNAPSLFQRVLLDCMNLKVDVSVYQKNRDTLYDMLTSLGFSCIKPEGAFYMFPKTLIDDDVAFCTAAKKYNLLIVPGSTFGCPGYTRLSYCVSYDTIVRSEVSFKKLAKDFLG
ncbi:MAG: pyridoxal phosphate-dependent aminotransferase [Clostridiales bacterium]|nr:pyridoxal phosphate-dependent aminotransferase [Clostridiales bacterium]